MEYRVGVIGGGLAGLTVSSLLPSSIEAIVFEEDKTIGYPKHCTGLVGEYTLSFYTRITSPRIIANRYYSVCFNIYGVDYCIHSRKPICYRLDRPLLEQLLYDKTLSRGHNVLLNCRVESIGRDYLETTSGRRYHVGYIVLAEGSKHYFTKKYIGSINKYIGIQYLARIQFIDPYRVHVVYHRGARDYFQWIVPVDKDTALIGYMSRGVVSRDKLLGIASRVVGRVSSVLESFGGEIPVDTIKWGVMEKLFPIGDTVPLTKPFSGGGLYGVSMATPYLVEAIAYGRPEMYWRFIKWFKWRQRQQLFLRRLCTRLHGLAYASRLVTLLNRLGVEIDSRDYDRHDTIVYKALPILVTQPWIYPYTLSSLRNPLKP